MDSARWNQIQDIFTEAADLPSDQRDTFLDRACGDDNDLRAEVMKLLKADRSAHSLFSGGGAAQALGLPSQRSLVGRRIGPFELEREIGTGGMGVVYLARRVDGQFEQQVAIKLIKRGMDTDQILARFQVERQILARLQHPNITPLLDGGVTDDGLPYFTMEYIEGMPIDRYCDEHRLTVEQRLQLFLDACAAVACAQQNLIVHRDLKPANIVVTKAGDVKLLDFGIAKLLGEDASPEEHGALTRTGFRVMTPGYASPEQVRGEPVTTASDVYSLGVVLYELLTGKRPYVVTGESIHDLEKAIVSTDPRRPSTAVVNTDGTGPATKSAETDPETLSKARRSSPERLRRRLSGDLDNICLMALRKDPARRYFSAEQLMEDLRRHLSGRPVIARPETFSYTLSKFIQRNRLAVAVAAVVVLVVASLTTFYTVRLSQERDRAQAEARKAAEVSTFLSGLFEIADPITTNGETVTARELLDRGSHRIETELAGQPEVQAEMLGVISKVYYNLGLYEEAEDAAEGALALNQLLYGENSLETALSLHRVAGLADINGRYDSAITLDRQAVAIITEQRGELDSLTASAITSLAIGLRHNGQLEESEQYYRRGLEIRRQLFGDAHPDVGHSLNHLGRLLQVQGKTVEAESVFREGLQIRREYYGTDANAEVGASFAALGGCLTELERYVEAEAMYRQSKESFAAVFGKDHPYTAGVIASLGQVMVRQNKYAEAESLVREAIAIHDRILPENHPHRSNSRAGLGDILIKMKRYAEAEPYLREAYDIRLQVYPEGNWRTAAVASALGEFLHHLGRLDESGELLNSSYEALRIQLGDSSRHTITARERLNAYLAANGGQRNR
ncbi:tetratricopeptide repeat protein [candidate division GN15 bacterium]|nr:tetratricopeptide repeat protein [candidate division GN15 bacterium]